MDKSITSEDYKVFLRELIASRKRGKLTQIDLAERIAETQSFVSKCERGERRLDVLELREFCTAFGITLTTFIERLEKRLATEKPPANRRRS